MCFEANSLLQQFHHQLVYFILNIIGFSKKAGEFYARIHARRSENRLLAVYILPAIQLS